MSRPQYTYWTDRNAQLHRISRRPRSSEMLVEWWAGTRFGWASLQDVEGYQGTTAQEIAERNGWEPMPFSEPRREKAEVAS